MRPANPNIAQEGARGPGPSWDLAGAQPIPATESHAGVDQGDPGRRKLLARIIHERSQRRAGGAAVAPGRPGVMGPPRPTRSSKSCDVGEWVTEPGWPGAATATGPARPAWEACVNGAGKTRPSPIPLARAKYYRPGLRRGSPQTMGPSTASGAATAPPARFEHSASLTTAASARTALRGRPVRRERRDTSCRSLREAAAVGVRR